jgi:hypothetical protein
MMVNLKRPLCLLPLLGGCYSYTPIAPTTVPAGTEVRARITGAASDRIAPLINSFDTRVLVGTVVETPSGSIVLQVPMGAMPNVAAAVVPLQTRVPLAPADLVSLEQRKLNVPRTSLMAGAVAAGIAAGVAVALRAGGGAEPGKEPEGPPPINRIPIWSVRF